MTALQAARERLRPHVEGARGFSGWMAPVHARVVGERRPWDYMRRARELLRESRSVVDLGTGGGERFADLLAGWRGRAFATEEWLVNAPIAARRLREVAAGVVRATTEALPFRDAAFDLVLDRHEALSPAEVARVLIEGGAALTQQVWRSWPELDRFLPRRTDFGDHFGAYQAAFRAAGLRVVDAREHHGLVAFEGLGDFVFLLCIAPWEVPDFDPLGRDLEALLELEAALSGPEGLVLTEGSYVIEAWKPLQSRANSS
jgi:hypothetical protein